ncbi:putative Holliday junction resolvase [Lewinella marina]|uniref:Putative pre-16S rRNA nuclease n=1 Tax=Neolewinella marina TaxID=438751 RepID=A0A2G0CGV6_9BACT|nr:Holliday junction resolvase RuvX [Neolewinella marina]NJB86315.1 putative Holliday junction resolvase [Neolewinella marina]PHK99214.1 Holliday junction resolvase RuvX [Neolewinella marina]
MRILAIDYGSKKCGIAATDPLQLIAQGLETVPTHRLFDWLETYLQAEEVSDLVIGESLQLDGTDNPIQAEILGFERKFRKRYPNIQLHRQDEFHTSRRARESMLAMGLKKKDRRDKQRVDRIAAALILQDFMETRG